MANLIKCLLSHKADWIWDANAILILIFMQRQLYPEHVKSIDRNSINCSYNYDKSISFDVVEVNSGVILLTE